MNDNSTKGSVRRGRPLRGTVVRLKKGPHAGQLQGIVTLADGSRQRLPVFPKGTSVAMAQDRTTAKQEAVQAEGKRKPERRPGPAAVAPAGTVAGWFERFAANRESRGLTSVGDDRGRFVAHVAPVLGTLEMRSVTKSDVEALVRSLDAKVRANELGWKTAQNVWVLVSKMFSEAVRSKVQDLRVRDDNPCTNVAPPDTGASKAKVYLYPNELLALLSCERVPLRWRRAIALAVYTGMRAGEQDALTWGDVDLEHGTMFVHQAIDRSQGGEETKTTKTGVARRFRIEPNLMPLLSALRLTDRSAVVAPTPPEGTRSARLRKWLLAAKVDRAELHASDAARKPLGWHDLRATAATWAAVRGDEPLKIMHRLGHQNFSTTQIYVREAETVRDGFGEPFPPLPQGFEITPTITEGLSVGNYGVSDGDRTLAESTPQHESPLASEPPVEITEGDGGAKCAEPASRSRAQDHASDPIEAALASAIAEAASAGRFEVLPALVSELEARRRARAGVVDIETARKKRNGGES